MCCEMVFPRIVFATGTFYVRVTARTDSLKIIVIFIFIILIMTPGSLAVVLIALCAIIFNFSIHKIEEGHVGVYFRGGALLSTITSPGKEVYREPTCRTISSFP